MGAVQAVADIKAQGAFDTSGANVTDETIRTWLDAKHREMLVRAKFRKELVELGPTVAGQQGYDIPDRVSEITALQVGGSAEWTRLKIEDFWALLAQQAALTGGSVGAYAETRTTATSLSGAGNAQVALYPTPTAAGLSITALCVVIPSALTIVPDSSLVVPADFYQPLISGAIGMGLERTDARFDISAGFNAQFEQGVQLLKRRSLTRVGQGPVQFRVAGTHF